MPRPTTQSSSPRHGHSSQSISCRIKTIVTLYPLTPLHETQAFLVYDLSMPLYLVLYLPLVMLNDSGLLHYFHYSDYISNFLHSLQLLLNKSLFHFEFSMTHMGLWVRRRSGSEMDFLIFMDNIEDPFLSFSFLYTM
jgi:hypothetical protein